MRVVSQDRCISLDFERTMFWRQYEFIYARIVGDSLDRVIGKYESDERAAEVFEDIHKAYSGMPILFQNVEVLEEFQQKLKKWNANCIFTHLTDASPKVEQIGNSVYYMPEV